MTYINVTGAIHYLSYLINSTSITKKIDLSFQSLD